MSWRRKDSKLDLLRDTALFAGLPRRVLVGLERLLDPVDVAPRTVLAEQGHLAREFLVVVEGTADVERDGLHVGEVGAGEILGELAFFGDHRRTATVRARTPMRVLVGNPRSFRALLALPIVAARIRAAALARLQSPAQAAH